MGPQDTTARRRFEARQCSRHAFGFAELLITFGCISLLAAAFLPQIGRLRQSSRKWSCQSNLTQIGLALDTYHSAHLSFPPGYFPSNYQLNELGSATWPGPSPSYAWSAFLLPNLGYTDLHVKLSVGSMGLPDVVADKSRAGLLATRIPEFRCSSDQIGDSMETAPLNHFLKALDREKDPGDRIAFGGSSSYVANGGYFELKHPQFLSSTKEWTKQYARQTGPNNGVFHTASRMHRRQISDGLSTTISIGERAWYQGSATWVGTRNVGGMNGGDSGVSLGRVWWRINEIPHTRESNRTGFPPYLVSRSNGKTVGLPHSARNGFGSYHPDGANFLMCDGSVRFISDKIEFRNTIPVAGANPLDPVPDREHLGLFQKLGIRNDSLSLDDEGPAK